MTQMLQCEITVQRSSLPVITELSLPVCMSSAALLPHYFDKCHTSLPSTTNLGLHHVPHSAPSLTGVKTSEWEIDPIPVFNFPWKAPQTHNRPPNRLIVRYRSITNGQIPIANADKPGHGWTLTHWPTDSKASHISNSPATHSPYLPEQNYLFFEPPSVGHCFVLLSTFKAHHNHTHYYQWSAFLALGPIVCSWVVDKSKERAIAGSLL